jgi:hypothetical protein
MVNFTFTFTLVNDESTKLMPGDFEIMYLHSAKVSQIPFNLWFMTHNFVERYQTAQAGRLKPFQTVGSTII